MFSERSSHCHPGNGFHARGGRSQGFGGLGCSGGRFDDMLFGGRASLRGRQRGGRGLGWGREGGSRLDDTPMLRRGRESMSELMDGIGALNLGGGGRNPLGSRGSSLLGGRSPMEDDLFGSLGGRPGGLLGRGMGMGMGPGMGMGGLGSRDSLLGGRAGLIGSGLLGAGSRANSSRASSLYDLQALDRPRMPYGPLGPLGPCLQNYRSPYVEDYFSDIDPEELLYMQQLERLGGNGFWLDDPYDEGIW
ncbi:hypothetical protein L207DRAFT_515731 [Hyaloscypha variabilis F]|uniref:Uncharacterized protein n=1 Tax=Hyaloscypha variabilis (strain UAMH 11265 / GT02V1 / F) TaxID=1149755 RepID=A0A2J6RBW5_HYAVF|nr:hypothetical protein L207DRAFT_515731 [Hyaloscypha variabilis F]